MRLDRLRMLEYLITYASSFASGTPSAFLDRRVRNTVTFAYNHCQYYRHRFDSNHIDPSSIRTVSDLSDIPWESKANFRRVPADARCSANAKNLGLYEHASSGSTGIPMRFWLDKTAHYIRWALIERVLYRNGYLPHHRVVRIVYPDKNKLWYHKANIGLYNLYDIPITTPIDEARKFLEYTKPDFLISYPSYLKELAYSIRDNPVDLTCLRVIITGAECCRPATRTVIEEYFSCRVADMYGASEVGTIAWQCKRSDLYHINADVVIWSLLDESGSESKTGSGKIVLTNLYYKASPVIRYCIDDHVTIADRPCKCGHSEPCIGKIIGRDNDYILIKDKRRIPPDVVESLISNNIRDVKQYQLLQHDYAKFTLSVVPDTHCDVDAVRTVVWQMSRALGDSDIKIELVDRIPKISGRHKLATIISLLDDGSV